MPVILVREAIYYEVNIQLWERNNAMRCEEERVSCDDERVLLVVLLFLA